VRFDRLGPNGVLSLSKRRSPPHYSRTAAPARAIRPPGSSWACRGRTARPSTAAWCRFSLGRNGGLLERWCPP